MDIFELRDIEAVLDTLQVICLNHEDCVNCPLADGNDCKMRCTPVNYDLEDIIGCLDSYGEEC